jgi:hypothetical protein
MSLRWAVICEKSISQSARDSTILPVTHCPGILPPARSRWLTRPHWTTTSHPWVVSMVKTSS